jgi:5,6-dimethylbenzimidazole synthase
MTGPVFDDAFRAHLDELFHWRRDVRRFRPDPLPHGLLPRLLTLANAAPSVGLSQPWRFVTVEDPRRRAAIRANFQAANAAALAAQPDNRAALYARLKLAGLDEAPVHLAVCIDPDPAQGGGLGRATQPEMTAYSAVLAIHTLWLAARAEGLGVGWVSILDPAAALHTLAVPASWRLVAYLCIGLPQDPSDTPELERNGWAERQALNVLER